MAPLGRLADVPAGEKIFEIAGEVKFTGLQITASKLERGKLSGNIKQVTARGKDLTLVLNDGYQIITKNCLPDDIKKLECYISKIKNGKIQKAPAKSKLKMMEESLDPFGIFDEIKENIENKSAKKPRTKSPVAQNDCFIVQPGSSETPTKSPLIRKVNRKTRVKILDSPVSRNGFEIIESRTTDAPSPESSSPWSRPPNEERSHSPSLLYGCKSSSPVMQTSPFASRMKIQGTKRPKPDISPLKQKNKSACFEPSNFTQEKANDENIQKPKTAYGSMSSGGKKQNSSTRLLDVSQLKPRSIQFDDSSLTPKATPNKITGEETAPKSTSFYGTSSSGSAFTSSLSGLKRKFTDRPLKERLPQRQLASQSETKDRFRSYSFHKRVKENDLGSDRPITLTGFANLGNTCYMNAILQCILGIPTFAQDLDNQQLLRSLSTNSLYRSLHNLLVAKRSEPQGKQSLLLRIIKRAISNQAARFSGYLQHDAHEFLGQCLDQLKDDTMSLLPKQTDESNENEAEIKQRDKIEAACPVVRNFECEISHTIECKNCGEKITKEEKFHDFSLDIPEIDENTAPNKNLQSLLQDYFKNENVSYKCEECGSTDANLSHHFRKLPRVIILHLKRYGLDSKSTKCRKKLDIVEIPNDLDLGILCTEKTADPVVFEKKVISATKRALSNEEVDDLADFQPGLKVRRKLSMPSEPRLTDPSEKDKFDEDLEIAKKLSLETINLDTMTEDEQMELAIRESIKADENSFWDISELIDTPLDVLDMGLSQDKKVNGVETAVRGDRSNFTGVRSKADQRLEKTEVEVINKSGTGNCTDKESKSVHENEEKLTNSENEGSLVEGISLFESEDNMLDMVLELSLLEYNQLSASKNTDSAKKRKLEENTSDNVKKSTKSKTESISNLPPKNYQLIGIVSHMGDSSNMGHYISDVFDPKSEEWKSYNDTAVKKVTDYEVRYGRKRSAYIFFYIHEDCLKVFSQS